MEEDVYSTFGYSAAVYSDRGLHLVGNNLNQHLNGRDILVPMFHLQAVDLSEQVVQLVINLLRECFTKALPAMKQR